MAPGHGVHSRIPGALVATRQGWGRAGTTERGNTPLPASSAWPLLPCTEGLGGAKVGVHLARRRGLREGWGLNPCHSPQGPVHSLPRGDAALILLQGILGGQGPWAGEGTGELSLAGSLREAGSWQLVSWPQPQQPPGGSEPCWLSGPCRPQPHGHKTAGLLRRQLSEAQRGQVTSQKSHSKVEADSWRTWRNLGDPDLAPPPLALASSPGELAHHNHLPQFSGSPEGASQRSVSSAPRPSPPTPSP